MSVDFFLDCIPPTVNHQSGRVLVTRKMWSPKRNRMVPVPQLADSSELKDAKIALERLLVPHRIATPIPAPISLTLEFTWPWLTSHSKRVRSLGRVPKSTRPDLTNTCKTFEDRLGALGFIADDGEVSELIVRKYFGDRPGIRVAIAPYIDASLPIVQLAKGL